MPSKRPEETPSRIKRSLNLTSKNLTKTIEKLQKPKYNTPQKVLLNLATARQWIATEKNWIYVRREEEASDSDENREEDSDGDIFEDASMEESMSTTTSIEESAEDTEEYLGLVGIQEDDDKSLEELQEFLKTQGNYIITQFGPIVWIYCSTAKDKKKILKTWGKMKMICGLPVFIQSFNEKEYQDYFFEYMALKKSSGGCLSSLMPKITRLVSLI